MLLLDLLTVKRKLFDLKKSQFMHNDCGASEAKLHRDCYPKTFFLVGVLPIFKRLISVEEAQRLLISCISEIQEVEIVTIDDALGRVAAENIYAKIDIPCFDRATRDGYAVIAEDTYDASEKNPVKLILRGYIKTGTFPTSALSHGQAFRIDTGAPIPRGANAIVPIEYTNEEDEYVIIFRRVHPWANIQWASGDIARGELVVQRGTIITPRHIGALAGTGHSKIKVKRKPRVAIFSIGDELVEVDSDLQPGKIYDINIHTLASLVRELGGEPVVLGIARDNHESILDKIKRGMRNADIIVSSGGSSVGQSDFIRAAVEQLGAEILFHGVMSKPGKPVLGSKIRNKLYIGLPGNPASAILSFMLYVKPVLLRMLGARPPRRAIGKIKLRKREYGVKGRRLYKTVVIKIVEDKYFYEPLPASSESISTLSKADAYFIVPEYVEFLESGEYVDLSFLDRNPQPADILIIGEFSPTILKLLIEALSEEYSLRYIRRNEEATIAAIRSGIADIAILGTNVGNSVKITRKIALSGRENGEIVTAMKDFGENTTIVGTHQSAILRYLHGLADGVIVPKELLELYGIKKYRIIGEEKLYVYSSDRPLKTVRDALRDLGDI